LDPQRHQARPDRSLPPDGNDMDYTGEGTSEDMKNSIGLALQKVEKQIKKHKEIVKDHLHKNRVISSG
jgi:ribosome-associated translation inhibitor RaiA